MVDPAGPVLQESNLPPNATCDGFCHITSFGFGCGGRHMRFWAVWSAVVSHYRWLDLTAGMGRFPSQSTSSRNILSNSANGSAPHRGCHHGNIIIIIIKTFCFNSCNWHLYVAALPRTRTRKAGQRVPWTPPEREAVQRRLSRNILQRQVPRKEECESARNAEPIGMV